VQERWTTRLAALAPFDRGLALAGHREAVWSAATHQRARLTDKELRGPAAQLLCQVILFQIVFDFIWSAI
jgi:hypothetical protein